MRTKAVVLYKQKQPPVVEENDLVTRVRPLDEVNAAFADMAAGNVARTVLVP